MERVDEEDRSGVSERSERRRVLMNVRRGHMKEVKFFLDR